MPADLPLRCTCGAFRGVLREVTPGNVNRLVCYCDDCQCFAHALLCADAILDAHGGTDIVQTSPARVEIAQGADQLACLRLRDGGIVRWHTRCCRTPIGNTLATRQLPFVGLIRRGCLDGGRTAEDALGPVQGRVFGRFARGDHSGLDTPDGVSARQLFRFGRIALAARLRGDHRRSPFFRPDGGLAATPHVLTDDELRAAEAARNAS